MAIDVDIQCKLQHPGDVQTLQQFDLTFRRYMMASPRSWRGSAPYPQHVRLTESLAYVLPQILTAQKRPSSPCWRQIDPLRFHAAHLTMPRPGPCRLAELLTRNSTSC